MLQEEKQEQKPTDPVLERSEAASDDSILYAHLEEESMESTRGEETLIVQGEVSTEEMLQEEGQEQQPTDPEEKEAVSVEVLSDKEISDRIVWTEEGLARWSQNASLSQALFELAQQKNLQVKATSVSVVCITVGNEKVSADGATREEASVKALSLTLEGLKNRPEQIQSQYYRAVQAVLLV
ncbi:hypothetical protein WMY93_002783 [Mugilogobius chulae]|uniref:Uncharacterized protein n=1 Tax=Mugilogobius chulae TaxID=88201 RepID=A0AAW0Q4M2_9GOBI